MGIGENIPENEEQKKFNMLWYVRKVAEIFKVQKLRKQQYQEYYNFMAETHEETPMPSFSELKYHIGPWGKVCLKAGLYPGRSTKVSEEDIDWKIIKEDGKLQKKFI